MMTEEGDLEYADPDGDKILFGRLDKSGRHYALVEDRDGWFFLAATNQDNQEIVVHVSPEFIDDMVDFVNQERMKDLGLHNSVGRV